MDVHARQLAGFGDEPLGAARRSRPRCSARSHAWARSRDRAHRAALPAALTARLATRISGAVDRRLRLAAVLRDARSGEFLDQLLDQALPPAAELADQMNGAPAMSTETWRPFGIADEEYDEASDGRGQKILNITWRRPKSERKAAKAASEATSRRTWLRSALVGLGVLAAAAAAVSFAAQYQLVFAAKGVRWASRARGRHPGRRGDGVRRPGYRPGPEGQAGAAGPRRQPRVRWRCPWR